MNKNLIKFNTVFNTGALVLALASLALICGCSKQRGKNELNYDELKQNAYAQLKNNNDDLAADYFEEIVSRFSDQQDISMHKLTLAETYFKIGKFPAAYELYNHYAQFYPADEKAEYAKYKAILCKFYLTLNSDCDQTTTAEATKLCKEYLENNSYKQYLTDVQDIQHTCEHKLVEKEIYVFNFYLKQKKYTAAQNRIKTLEKEYLPQNPKLEDRILFLKCQLAKKQGKKDEFKNLFDQLSTKFPDSQFTQLAQNIKQKNASDFFF